MFLNGMQVAAMPGTDRATAPAKPRNSLIFKSSRGTKGLVDKGNLGNHLFWV
jgi:hypothetical protein